MSDIKGPEDCPLALGMMKKLTKAGAKKHGANSWLDEDNPSMETTRNFKSICSHAAKAAFSPDKYDEETEVLHYIAVAWRGLAKAERILRGIDKE